MIMVLKILSVCSDVSTKQLKTPPPFVDYLGYIFCPANMAFGPWIPISVYMRLFEPKKLVSYVKFLKIQRKDLYKSESIY